jgi:hypothetical protein
MQEVVQTPSLWGPNRNTDLKRVFARDGVPLCFKNSVAAGLSRDQHNDKSHLKPQIEPQKKAEAAKKAVSSIV